MDDDTRIVKATFGPAGFHLSTGRVVEFAFGLLSINTNLELFGGYDQTITLYDLGGSPLTAEERSEVAAAQIELWQRWAAEGSPPQEEW